MRRARTKAVVFFSAFIGRMPVSSMQQSVIERHCGVEKEAQTKERHNTKHGRTTRTII